MMLSRFISTIRRHGALYNNEGPAEVLDFLRQKYRHPSTLIHELENTNIFEMSNSISTYDGVKDISKVGWLDTMVRYVAEAFEETALAGTDAKSYLQLVESLPFNQSYFSLYNEIIGDDETPRSVDIGIYIKHFPGYVFGLWIVDDKEVEMEDEKEIKYGCFSIAPILIDRATGYIYSTAWHERERHGRTLLRYEDNEDIKHDYSSTPLKAVTSFAITHMLTCLYTLTMSTTHVCCLREGTRPKSDPIIMWKRWDASRYKVINLNAVKEYIRKSNPHDISFKERTAGWRVGHLRFLSNLRYTNKRFRYVKVRPAWVGPIKFMEYGHKYKVVLDWDTLRESEEGTT